MTTPIVPDPPVIAEAPRGHDRHSFGEMLGDALREIGILLAVFGWLEPWHRNELTLRSLEGVLGIAILAFGLGALVERMR
jgi:hypothetical protein